MALLRYLYSFLLYLAMPYLFIRLLWKSRRLPAYRERLAERLGFFPFKLDQCLWLHAVSVGEAIAAAPMIKALLARYPSVPLLVTTMTPTGSAQIKKMFGGQVRHVYIPYDFPDATARFIKTMNPKAGIIMETELWPNLYASCKQHQVPVSLLNARLSEKSAEGYEKIGGLVKEILQSLSYIVSHAQADAKRFIRLGADKEKVIVSGSIKFDLELPQELLDKAVILHEQLGKEKFIWIAASTHEGEDEIILAAHQQLHKQYPHSLLILVPRHPERFDSVAALCEKMFSTVRRSHADTALSKADVYLGDTMGELLLMYAVSDAAFVGGSLIPHGGHNLLEPAALGKPLLSGSHVFNFQDICSLLLKEQALKIVPDADSLAAALVLWAQDAATRRKTGEAARKVVDANRGALKRQLEVVDRFLANIF